MVDWGSAFYDHFAKYLGEPIKRGAFRQNQESQSIQVLHYENVFEGCTVFVSFGLSKYASELGTVAEVCLVTDCAFEESENILANTLFYLIANKINLGRGVSISGVSKINEEFSKLYDKSAMYFTMPYAFPDGFEKIKPVGATDEGNIYLAFFLSQREHDFFVDKGSEIFESVLEDKDIDPFTLTRSSVI